MKIIDIENIPQEALNGVISIGSFDGVHLGHSHMFEKINSISNSKIPKTIISFTNHPRLIIENGQFNFLLNTFDEKVELLRKKNIDFLLVINFDENFAKISAKEFINNYINKLQPKHIVIGREHFFGNNKQGNIDLIKNNALKNNIEIHEVQEYFPFDTKVSSSIIRNLLLDGKLAEANKLLGYNYLISGIVNHGLNLGTKLGFPTANIKTEASKLIPLVGVYSCKVYYLDKTFGGMLYIGTRPTLDMKEVSIEVNIFDFNETIYNQNIKVELIERLRDDIKFANQDELIEQLKKDKIVSLESLKCVK